MLCYTREVLLIEYYHGHLVAVSNEIKSTRVRHTCFVQVHRLVIDVLGTTFCLLLLICLNRVAIILFLVDKPL